MVAELSRRLEHPERRSHFRDQMAVDRGLHGSGLRLVPIRDTEDLHVVVGGALGHHRFDGVGNQQFRLGVGRIHGK